MTVMRLAALAEWVGGQVHGDPELEISGAEILREAKAGQISFVADAKFANQIPASEASAIVVSNSSVHLEQLPDERSAIVVSDVTAAFEQIVACFSPPRQLAHPGISSSAHCHPTATIAPGACIHAGAFIDKDVCIEADVVIHSGVRILAGARIGEGTILFPNAVIYENSQIGARCILHANAVIGAYGFGYDSSSGKHVLSAQLGNVVIEDDVEIGAGTTIDRGTFGTTKVGKGTKIDNQVMIGHNCRIGEHNLLCSQVGIAGSCTTGDNVVMAGQVGIGDHLDIEKGAVLGAKAGVMTRIPAGEAWVGIPATPIREQLQKQAALGKLPDLRKQIKQLQSTVRSLEEAVFSASQESKPSSPDESGERAA